MDEIKQAIIVRADLKMSKGKVAAQVAHGSLEAALKVMKRDEQIFKKWRSEGMKKVVLKVESENELIKRKSEADMAGLTNALITDAGHTELPAGTRTVLAIGPDKERNIDEVTGDLKAY